MARFCPFRDSNVSSSEGGRFTLKRSLMWTARIALGVDGSRGGTGRSRVAGMVRSRGCRGPAPTTKFVKGSRSQTIDVAASMPVTSREPR